MINTSGNCYVTHSQNNEISHIKAIIKDPHMTFITFEAQCPQDSHKCQDIIPCSFISYY